MCSGPYPDVHSQALSRWANTGAHTHCQHFAQVRWFLTRIEESLQSTTPKKGHTWLWNFKELSACFEPVLSIKTRWTHCMCAACGSSESSQSVWSFSISLSPTAQHWDSPPSCPEWPPSGSRHSWRSNTGFTRSQCCIWHDWPPPTTSYTGVIIKKSTSEPHELQYGVPQGSVLGPILFTIYTTPLCELIRRHGLTFHLYADDTQLYLTFKPSEPSSINNIISQLENCIEDFRAWMKLNLLKLNDDKTEMLVITSRPSTSQSLNISVKVGDQYINPSDEPPKKPWSYLWFHMQPQRSCCQCM